MKLLAFAATNSRNSINANLVRAAATVIEAEISPGTEIEILDLNDFEMPIYSIDREKADGIPDLAQTFYDKIGSADALLISFAEHNGAYTVAYKNVFDWASRIGSVFQKKPLIVMATSPGARGGANVLALISGSASHLGAELKGSYSLPSFNDNFDTETKTITNAEKASELKATLSALF